MSDRFEHADCADDYHDSAVRGPSDGRVPAWAWREADHRIHSIGDPICVAHGCEPSGEGCAPLHGIHSRPHTCGLRDEEDAVMADTAEGRAIRTARRAAGSHHLTDSEV